MLLQHLVKPASAWRSLALCGIERGEADAGSRHTPCLCQRAREARRARRDAWRWCSSPRARAHADVSFRVVGRSLESNGSASAMRPLCHVEQPERAVRVDVVVVDLQRVLERRLSAPGMLPAAV